MSKLVLIGGGGFAKEVHEIAELAGHEVVGYVADAEGVVDLPHLGTIDRLDEWQSKFDHLAMGFGAVDRRSLGRRAQVIGELEAKGFTFQSLVSPHAVVSRGVEIAAGAVVAHGVVISVDAKIGAHAILNTSAIVGHDAVIGERAIVAPNAFVGGSASIGRDCLIGPSSVVLEGRTVSDEVIVSLGSLVLRNVDKGMTILPNRSQPRR
jgi:acetyltransferase EpsM